MKGQYLAVETVFIFGIGVMLTVGVITIFQSIRTETLNTGEEEQVDLVFSRIEQVLYSLKTSDGEKAYSNATYKLNLPERVGGSDYRALVEEDLIRLTVNSKDYSHSIAALKNYTVSGSFQGGSVTIFKNQKDIRIGSS